MLFRGGGTSVEKRLNGQHTCWMRVYMPDDWKVQIRWIRYRVTSEDDFRKLYASIDRGAPRTRGHIVSARLYGTEEFTGFSKQTLALFQASIPVWLVEKHHERSKYIVDDVANMMQGKYNALCRILWTFMDKRGLNGRGHHMYRAPVIAAMLATFHKNAAAAEEFWDRVESGLDMPALTDPRYRLREFLMRACLRSPDSKVAISISTDEMYNVCLYCWNCYRSGQPIKVIRSPESRPAVK